MSKKIVVIEDDSAIREDLIELLQMENYDVKSYSNGKEGLDGLELTPVNERPSLILLDLMMPVMDGYHFLEEIKKRSEFSAIAILIMSADGQAPKRLNMDRATAFVKKPIELDPFLALIEQHS